MQKGKLIEFDESLSDTIRSSVPGKGNAKRSLDAIRENFKESEKNEIVNLMSSFMNKKMTIWEEYEIIYRTKVF